MTTPKMVTTKLTATKKPKKPVTGKLPKPPKVKPPTTLQLIEAYGVDKIMEEIIEGNFFEDIAKRVGIGRHTLTCNLDKHWTALYTSAREARTVKMAEDIIKIADDGQNDTYVDAEGNVHTNQDVIARSRLRVDSRKWLASKMLPKVYGEKLDLNATVATRNLSDEDLNARLLALLQVKQG